MAVKKIKGATLIEVLVAMVILSVSMVLGGTAFVQVLEAGQDQQKLNATLLLDRIAVETKKEKAWLDETKIEQGWKVLRSVEPYRPGSTVSLFTLRAYDEKGTLVAERKELVIP